MDALSLFKVRKRDGAWWVLDREGRLRYASGSHRMALAFAMVVSARRQTVTWVVEPQDLGYASWAEAIADMLKKDRDEDR